MSVKSKSKGQNKSKKALSDHYIKAIELMFTARKMADLYDEHKEFSSRYVHSTSKGHEAIQLACAFQMTPVDFASLYYRDESFLLGIGMRPYELMLQLMAKKDDPFSGGRTYYAHPALRREGFPTIPHQSSATGMQAIPATGMAHGIKYLQSQGLLKDKSVVVCSIGDGAVTEGEVAEAMQMAVLKELPILFLVQDNDWGISASGDEMRTMNAFEYAAGFKGMTRYEVDGSDFDQSFRMLDQIFKELRQGKGPVLLHATVPLLGHHTSGVRKEWYRDAKDLKDHGNRDPLPQMIDYVTSNGLSEAELEVIKTKAFKTALDDFEKAREAEDPVEFDTHEFAPTAVEVESGERAPKGAEKVVMVDAALHAVREILEEYPNALFYGQDVGERLGGVFREAATLATNFGNDRVFNTPIQEAYIVGSTAGMSAVGALPIVEIQFADYVWPGLNQLVEELSKSSFLTMGQFPIQSLIRIPTGAYGGGGPYHSGSVESSLLNIRGIKVVYPSNAADLKGLMKAAFKDPNPVVMLEHKGLYWSKVKGTDAAKTLEPDAAYEIPLGKGRVVKEASPQALEDYNSLVVITYGMGVHWSLNIEKDLRDSVEILDLRTLNPLDWDLVEERVKLHSRALVLTEEPLQNSFAESLAGRISEKCFKSLDAPVSTLGALNVPAIPLNKDMEAEILPNANKVSQKIKEILEF